MGEGLRILIVEDVEADAILAARELKRAGMTVESRRVELEQDFRRVSCRRIRRGLAGGSPGVSTG